MSIPPTLLEWSRGVASLSPGVPPSPGLRPDEWAETHRRCGESTERWGMQAVEAGCDTLILFGVSPEFGVIRGDWKGHLLPLVADVTEVNAEFIRIGPWRAHRHEPVKMSDMVQVWKFKRTT